VGIDLPTTEQLKRVSGVGCRVPGVGFRVPGVGFRVLGAGFRVQGSGFSVASVLKPYEPATGNPEP
jgi:hypothetical protein